MDSTIYQILFVPASAMIAVVLVRGFRNREPPQQILDATLFPGALILFCLAHIFPRWRILFVVATVALSLTIVWRVIRPRRR